MDNTVVVVGVSLGFWGWGFIGLEFIVLFVAAALERTAVALGSFVAFILLIWFFIDVNPFVFFINHWIVMGTIALIYIPFGVWFAVQKWKREVRREHKKFNELLAKFITEQKKFLMEKNFAEIDADTNSSLSSKADEDAKSTVKKWVEDLEAGTLPDILIHKWGQYARGKGAGMPIASDNKDRICAWIFVWPWSMLWYLLNDFIIDVARALWEHLSTTFERIAQGEFSNVDSRIRMEKRRR